MKIQFRIKNYSQVLKFRCHSNVSSANSNNRIQIRSGFTPKEYGFGFLPSDRQAQNVKLAKHFNNYLVRARSSQIHRAAGVQDKSVICVPHNVTTRFGANLQNTIVRQVPKQGSQHRSLRNTARNRSIVDTRRKFYRPRAQVTSDDRYVAGKEGTPLLLMPNEL